MKIFGTSSRAMVRLLPNKLAAICGANNKNSAETIKLTAKTMNPME